MFGFLKTKTTTPTFTLNNTVDGWAIMSGPDEYLATYTRKADALRGAARKGITLTNA